jgi:Asp-tRNA(Asn)/Glu-tRNA(Gln) amidotransferase A subunit family amidase
VVSLPAGPGRDSGLPTGVSLIGRPGSDPSLAGAGRRLEALLAG